MLPGIFVRRSRGWWRCRSCGARYPKPPLLQPQPSSNTPSKQEGGQGGTPLVLLITSSLLEVSVAFILWVFILLLLLLLILLHHYWFYCWGRLPKRAIPTTEDPMKHAIQGREGTGEDTSRITQIINRGSIYVVAVTVFLFLLLVKPIALNSHFYHHSLQKYDTKERIACSQMRYPHALPWCVALRSCYLVQ